MTNKYAKVFAIIKQLNEAGANITREELLFDFTEGNSTSLKALNDWQLAEFERRLSAMSPKTVTNASKYKNDPLDKARKAIIAQFKSIGSTAEVAIAWAEKYGTKGVKKRFNEYDGQELWWLIRVSEKVKHDFIKSINNKLMAR